MRVAEEVRTVQATRYVTPLREGGSLPGLMEADDDGLYVVKYRGAGQGPRVLIAELLAGEIGRALGLRTPEIVFIEVDGALSKAEPDPEIQDLLRSSAGLNIGIDFLPGALAYWPQTGRVDPEFAARVVWFDALLMNVDRTPRNPNMLIWHGNPWLIDHGASIYVHHATDDIVARADSPFALISEHILLPYAAPLDTVADDLAARLTIPELERIVALIPDDWIAASRFSDPKRARERYVAFFTRRLEYRRRFEEEAERARSRAI
jgi:hypothetical protein